MRGAYMRGRSRQHRNGHVGDVVLGDDGRATVVGRAADDSVRADHCWDEVHVEVVAQERPPQAAGSDALLGCSAMAGERERGSWCGAAEGHVDDVFDAGCDGRVDEAQVPPDAVGCSFRAIVVPVRPRCGLPATSGW
jgi:hypothetical protein